MLGRRTRRFGQVLAVVLAGALIAAACGDDDSAGSATTATATTASDAATASTGATAATAAATGTTAAVTGEIVVFAAASLTNAFGAMGKKFQEEHPGVTVTFNFAASSDLATQIGQGAPADSFASADTANMKKVTDAGGAAGAPITFARNRLQIIVGNGNPKQIKGLADLANRRDLTLALCAPQVPCGAYATKAFQQAGLTVPEASQEQNVRAVVDKVGLGEADAGIGYATDVKARDADVDGVDIPDTQNVIATYPQVVLEEAGNPAGAAAWNAYVLSAEGQAALAEAGFLEP